MSFLKQAIVTLASASMVAVPVVAAAQAPDDAREDEATEVEPDDEARQAEPLPPPESSDEPYPPVASPAPVDRVVKQAGVGSQTAYGRAGVLELGGAAGFTAAPGLTAATLNPSVGWFFADNVQLSAILGLSYVSAQEESATVFSLVLEPSYHLPFSREVFGFLGLGIGGAHVEDAGFGFAIAPRLGANLLIGRSGILSPSLSYQYTTHDALDMRSGTQLAAVSTHLAFNVGYTVMW